MKAETVRIGDICELKYGKALKSEDRVEGVYPVYGSGGIIGYHNEYLTDQPTLIIGRKGSVGEIYYSEVPCWTIDTAYYLDYNSSRIYMPWFKSILQSLNLKRLDKSAAVPGLNRNDVYNLIVSIPTIKDQISVAYILGKTEELIAQRKESIRLLDELLKSTFLEMFLTGESREWEIRDIQSLASPVKGSMRTGPFGSDLLHDEFLANGDVKVLGIDNVVNNCFEEGRPRFISYEKYEKLKRYTVFPGDVLITIMATNGRSAVVPENIPLSINTKHLAAITLKRSQVNPYYVSYSLTHNPSILNQIKSQTRGAIMGGLNLTIIKSLKISLPPIRLQNQFAKIIEKVEAQKAFYQQSLQELEHLYGALSQKAFRGELTVGKADTFELNVT